jgi:hypothetical protein
MTHTRCNYCGQVVQFMEIRGNSTCPICRQSSTSCCEGGTCVISKPESVVISNVVTETIEEAGKNGHTETILS